MFIQGLRTLHRLDPPTGFSPWPVRATLLVFLGWTISVFLAFAVIFNHAARAWSRNAEEYWSINAPYGVWEGLSYSVPVVLAGAILQGSAALLDLLAGRQGKWPRQAKTGNLAWRAIPFIACGFANMAIAVALLAGASRGKGWHSERYAWAVVIISCSGMGWSLLRGIAAHATAIRHAASQFALSFLVVLPVILGTLAICIWGVHRPIDGLANEVRRDRERQITDRWVQESHRILESRLKQGGVRPESDSNGGRGGDTRPLRATIPSP